MKNNFTTSNKIASDVTGRDRIVSNILFSWGGYIIIFISGFILPRLIDKHVGQFSLGIWDFSWSLVSYINLAGLGVGSSVNRYVAKYRAEKDVGGLCSAVSSVACIQSVIALLVLLITLVLVWFLPVFFSHRLGAEIEGARWVVGFLGGSVAVQMLFDVSRGVITGCHRWDLLNGINAASRAIAVLSIAVVLTFGGGLHGVASAYFVVVIFTELIRMVVAYRVCPEIQISLGSVKLDVAKKMLRFGLKTLTTGLPQLIVTQTTSILIVSFLGPSSLAIFSRPMALVKHMETFMNRFSFILTPTVGALQGSERHEELKPFLIKTTRYGVAFSLPMVLFLSIYDDILLRLWMGSNYANVHILTILAFGHFLPVSQNFAMRVLIGMNRHGRIGIINFFISLLFFSIGILVINIFGMTLVSASFLVVVPLTLGKGIVVPVFACRKLGIPLMEYCCNVFITPVACGFAFSLCLLLSRLLFPPENVLEALWAGSITGALVLGGLYWRYLLTKKHQEKILCWVKKSNRSR